MNKEFIKKMIKAEKYRYDAIKEILPDNIKSRVESFEKEAFEAIRDIAFEIMTEEKMESKPEKGTKKVDVDFS